MISMEMMVLLPLLHATAAASAASAAAADDDGDDDDDDESWMGIVSFIYIKDTFWLQRVMSVYRPLSYVTLSEYQSLPRVLDCRSPSTGLFKCWLHLYQVVVGF